MLKSLVLFTLLLGGLIAWNLKSLERSLVFPGTWTRQNTTISAHKNVWTRPIGNDQNVQAFFFSAEKPQGLLVFAHGNGELIDDWIVRGQRYTRELHVDVLIIEYRGYGRSGGEPGEAAIIEDYQYFIDQYVQSHGEPEKLIYHGRSLGGGVVGTLTTFRAPTHLILESTFTDLASMAPDYHIRVPKFVASLLLSNRFETLNNIANYKGKLLVIHGLRDSLVPVHHARRLHESFNGEKTLFLQNTDHNDPPENEALYWEKLTEFTGP